MIYTIKSIQDQKTWDLFMDKNKPHTFLQSWQWGIFNEKMGNEIYRLGVYDTEKLVGIAMLYIMNAKRGRYLFCPNGPLIDWTNIQQIDALLKYLKEIAKKEKVNAIRLSPIEENNEDIKSMFKYRGFRNAPMHIHQEISWILDITFSEEDLIKSMKKSTRYSIRKAVKDGVSVIASNKSVDLDKFYNMHLKTVKRHKFVPFSREYIENEFGIFAKDDKALIYTAMYNNQPIASAFVIFSNGSAYYHHGASINEYRSIPAAELIQWEAIREAKRRGMSWYNFWGIAPENKPKHPWTGLTKFKQGFGGFAQHYLPTQDLPLTKWYFFGFVIDTIRKYKRGY